MINDAECEELQYALLYAKVGWRVVPVWRPDEDGNCSCPQRDKCHTPAKHPRTKNGHDGATADEREITRWKWAGANIGVATGAGSGILVVDIDPRNGGVESLKQLMQDLGPLPKDVMAHTGGGGWHIFLRHPGTDQKLRGSIAPGIDIKNDGMVVVPPSLHKSGTQYKWRQGCSPWENVPPAPPALWLRLLTDVAGSTDHYVTEKRRGGESERLTRSRDLRVGELEAIACRVPKEPGHSNSSVSPSVSPDRIEKIIVRTLPREPGDRNGAIFRLARLLKGLAPNMDLKPLRRIVEEWHERASPNTSGEHTAEDSWIDFRYGWERVKFPGEFDLMELARKIQASPPHPACRVLHYEGTRLHVLVGICASLQDLHGTSPFFLSARMAAQALSSATGSSVDAMTADRTLKLLVADKVIELVRKGGGYSASRYRFIWSAEESVGVGIDVT